MACELVVVCFEGSGGRNEQKQKIASLALSYGRNEWTILFSRFW